MRRSGRILIAVGVVAVALLLLGSGANEIYTDALWYAAQGYSSVFWTRIAIAAVVRMVTGVLGAGVVLVNLWFVTRQLGPVHLRRRYGNLEIAEQVPRRYLHAGIVVVALMAGWWLSGVSFAGDGELALAAWIRQVPWGIRDPLLGRDVGFYVLSLPAYYALSDFVLMCLVWSALLVALGYVLVGAVRWVQNRLYVSDAARLHFLLLVAALILLVGLRYWLGRYALLVEGSGFGGGLGYTDVHARLPVRGGLAVLSLIAAATLVYGAVRRLWLPPALGLGALLLGALLGGAVYPSIVQKLQVEPNQLAREAPYIRWNLEFTRRAYSLESLQHDTLSYRRGPLPPWDSLQSSLSALPLWDAGPFRTVLNQVQSGYGYYHFPQVDFDRYPQGGRETEVAIATREFNPDGLPPGSKSWVTLRLNPKYVRGMGVVVSPAADATPQGLPVLWLGDLDPIRRSPDAPKEIELTNPSVFIGESMTDYVVVVPGRDGAYRGRAGVDYPAGVQLDSWIRLLAYAWRFGDKNLLFSGELGDQSRLVFWRSVAERVHALAPFLLWDGNPYPVLRQGRIFWVVDGYTAAGAFPLSHPVDNPEGAGQLQYLHASVKAVIDAVTGRTTLYQVQDGDPLLETYRRIFPGLIRPWSAMPADIRAHLRYPAAYFEVQAGVLRQYHLRSAAAFYAGQDVWELPPESLHETAPGPYRPIYAMIRLPGESRPEFTLSTPFIARERQNMTALLVVHSDPARYGQMLMYELARDQQIPGPGQVQALIEQNPSISPKLTLWRQAGSEVDLGHLRVVPLDSGFLFIQPLFLSAQSSQGGTSPQSIPELSQVIVSDGSAVAMDSTLAGSVDELRHIVAGGVAPAPAVAAATTHAAALPAVPLNARDWPRQALQLYDQANRQLRAGDFAAFGATWRQLRAVLDSAGRPRH
jgi:uncharacterized membrane protein (UPF0182 family)